MQPDDKTPEGGRNTFVTAGDRRDTMEQEQRKGLKMKNEQDQDRFSKSHKHHKQRSCKIFRAWVNVLPEYELCCCKFNFLSTCLIFLLLKVWGN